MRLRTTSGPVRGRSRRPLGAVPAPPPPPPAPLGYNMPTLADLAPYQTTVEGFTAYKGVPWGGAFGVAAWNEPTLGNALTQPMMHVYMPNVAAPVDGYPVAMRTHANGSTLDIAEGAAGMWTLLVLPLLAQGYVVITIEFRHPVPNVALGAPHNDVGMALQFARGLHSALDLDRNKFHCYATSRGTLAVWQGCADDLSAPADPCYAKRQSSKFKSAWCIGLQPTYRNAEYINKLVAPADRAAMLAAPQYADDPAWGSIVALIAAGKTPPHICCVHEAAYVAALPDYTVGTRTRAALEADDALRLHNPDGGKWLREVMAAAGHADKVVICDQQTGNTAQMQDAAAWFKMIDDNPGMTAAEARNAVLIRRMGGSLHYLAQDGVGGYVSPTAPTPVTTLGAAVGAVVEGSYGYANRSSATPLGASMAQTNAALRPTLAALNGGTRRGFAMDAVDDEWRVLLANTTVDVYAYTSTGVVTGASARTSTRYTLTTGKVGGRTLALVAAVPNTTFSATDVAFLGQLGAEIAGV